MDPCSHEVDTQTRVLTGVPSLEYENRMGRLTFSLTNDLASPDKKSFTTADNLWSMPMSLLLLVKSFETWLCSRINEQMSRSRPNDVQAMVAHGEALEVTGSLNESCGNYGNGMEA